jgi:hypothetical protein
LKVFCAFLSGTALIGRRKESPVTTRSVRSALLVVMLMAGTARAASGQTCIVVDESRDMLAKDERTAAVLLVGRQFEQAGQRIADRDCAATYTVSHIRLGSTIIVTLSGPAGSREGKALGLDDLPAIYSQLVRSITTGEAMGSLSVLDRTNVSASQDQPPRRVQSDGVWYARVGYGSLFGPNAAQGGAAIGFGYRAEFDRFGIDVSFLNFQLDDDGGGYSGPNGASSSLVKLQGLYFTNPAGNRSAYFGGGLSYGHTEVRRVTTGDFSPSTYGSGSGLQAGLTAGYEIARVTSARMFVQADVTLPFYSVVFERYSYPSPPSAGVRYGPPTVTVEREYAPSIALSVGLGWSRRR